MQKIRNIQAQMNIYGHLLLILPLHIQPKGNYPIQDKCSGTGDSSGEYLDVPSFIWIGNNTSPPDWTELDFLIFLFDREYVVID